MKKVLCLLFVSLITIPVLAQDSEGDQPEKTPMKPALLVIDVQNKYIPMMSEADQKRAPEYINWCTYLFHYYKLPVINVYHTSPEWGPEPGSEEFAFHETIKVDENDLQVVKNYGNAFTKTNLDSILQAKGCNTLFLCGLSATGCVLATYIGASDHDYRVFMLENGLLSQDADQTACVQDFSNSISLEILNLLLENSME